jgi:hypothetical protein
MTSTSLSAEDLRTCAFVSLIWPLRLRRQGLRKLHPTLLLLRAHQLICEGDFHLARQFSGALCLAFRPSEIPAFLRPDTLHGSLQIGSLASALSGYGEPSGHQSPGSNVMQDSDFPWEITVRFFAAQKILPSPLVRRAAKQSVFFSPQNSYLVSPTNKMSRRNTPGTVPFALDISIEAKLRFMALHEAFGFKSKTATFEAVLFAMSLKDKIDPQILQRIDAKLDRVLESLEETL